MKGMLNFRETQINKNWRPDVTPAPTTTRPLFTEETLGKAFEVSYHYL